jgi:hypothetical protein
MWLSTWWFLCRKLIQRIIYLCKLEAQGFFRVLLLVVISFFQANNKQVQRENFLCRGQIVLWFYLFYPFSTFIFFIRIKSIHAFNAAWQDEWISFLLVYSSDDYSYVWLYEFTSLRSESTQGLPYKYIDTLLWDETTVFTQKAPKKFGETKQLIGHLGLGMERRLKVNGNIIRQMLNVNLNT